MGCLQASSYIHLPNAIIILERLLQHFEGHAKITIEEDHALLEMKMGNVAIAHRECSLHFALKSNDEADLAILKYSIAEHILEMLDYKQSVPMIKWQGDGAAGQPLGFLRVMRVVSVCNVTPHMRRIRLEGEDLERFNHNGLHIRLLFPPKGNENPRWPVMGEDGRPEWPDGDDKLKARVYTIRHINVAEGWVEIDMVVHVNDRANDDSPGARFAVEAQIGDIVGMTGPGGGDIEEGADWYLLAGDETALPAIGRILKDLPASAKAVVRIEIDNSAERQNLTTAADLDLQWLIREPAEAGTTEMLYQALRDVDYPDCESNHFIWVGCEFGAFRAIRNFIRKERKTPKDKHLVVAYWRRGTAGDDARRDTKE